MALAIYTSYYFKKHKPSTDGLLKRVYYEHQSITFFVVVQSILIILFDCSLGIVYFNCFKEEPVPELMFFATIMNLSKLLQTVFLVFFIQTDPTIKKKTKKYLRSFFKKNTKGNVISSFRSDQN